MHTETWGRACTVVGLQPVVVTPGPAALVGDSHVVVVGSGPSRVLIAGGLRRVPAATCRITTGPGGGGGRVPQPRIDRGPAGPCRDGDALAASRRRLQDI